MLAAYGWVSTFWLRKVCIVTHAPSGALTSSTTSPTPSHPPRIRNRFILVKSMATGAPPEVNAPVEPLHTSPLNAVMGTPTALLAENAPCPVPFLSWVTPKRLGPSKPTK